MDAAVFATDPCTADEARRGADEPGIGVVVGSAGLAAEVGIVVGIADESTQAGRRTTHTAHEQLLDVEGTLGRKCLTRFGIGFVNDVALAVLNFRDEHGVNGLAVVDRRAIGRNEFEQVDVAGSEGE